MNEGKNMEELREGGTNKMTDHGVGTDSRMRSGKCCLGGIRCETKDSYMG
jgi:hypothetical protein